MPPATAVELLVITEELTRLLIEYLPLAQTDSALRDSLAELALDVFDWA